MDDKLNSSKNPYLKFAQGFGEITFTAQSGETMLTHLYHKEPLKILLPKPGNGDIKQAILLNTGGGIVGGDIISLDARLKHNSQAILLAGSAEKVYKTSENLSNINVNLSAGPNTWLEYIPQETILFNESKLIRKTKINAHRSARILAGEIIVFGRVGSGEKFSSGFFNDRWQIKYDGKLTWADITILDGNIRELMEHPTCLHNMSAVATIVYVGTDAESHLDYARSLLNNDIPNLRVGATVVNGILVVRLFAKETLQLRNAFGNFWQNMRHHLACLPKTMPRLWMI